MSIITSKSCLINACHYGGVLDTTLSINEGTCILISLLKQEIFLLETNEFQRKGGVVGP